MIITLAGIQYDVSIKLQHYKNGRLRIDLIDKTDGMTVCTPTINIPDQECEIGHCWIKDYAENDGIFRQLRRNGVVALHLAVLPGSFGNHSYYCKFLNSHN